MLNRKLSSLLLGTALLLVLASHRDVRGQGQGGAANAQGIYVDADGVLRTFTVERGDRLNKARRNAAVARASGAVAGKTELRAVSLSRLAREVQQYASAGKPIPDEIRFLAGIQQIQFLFVYPEEQDLVIAGPAEGWQTDALGRVVGQRTGRPVVRLEDLVVALRVFAHGSRGDTIVGCTINQTHEGVRRLNQYMASLGPSIDRRRVDASLVQGVRDNLGLHDIEIWGVPPDSRLGLVLVEADYRMKLIGLGREDPRVRGLTSYYSLLGPGDGGHHKIQHWWFVPEYEAIIESEDGNAFELRGQRAKLLGGDDRLQATGQVERGDGATSSTTTRFALSFSSHFEQLARVNPAFAELQNAFDLVILSALINDRDMINQSAPDVRYFLDPEHGYVTESYAVPRQVESVVNAKWIGNKLAMPVGGVVVEPKKLLTSSASKRTPDSQLSDRRQQSRPAGTSKDRWWSDQ